jgi:hypothetical protein
LFELQPIASDNAKDKTLIVSFFMIFSWERKRNERHVHSGEMCGKNV